METTAEQQLREMMRLAAFHEIIDRCRILADDMNTVVTPESLSDRIDNANRYIALMKENRDSLRKLIPNAADTTGDDMKVLENALSGSIDLLETLVRWAQLATLAQQGAPEKTVQ